MAGKTELQREILVVAYDNPGLTQQEIARRVGCSPSYVSTVLGKYDGLDAMEARIDQLNSELGFASSGSSTASGEPEDVSVEDLGPLGVSVVAGLLAAFLLNSQSLLGTQPYLKFGIVAACGLVVVGVFGVFYRKSRSDGLASGVDWLFGNGSASPNSGTKADDSRTKTPPAPQSLKDDLYFDRANRHCEWCETRIDAPDVHHIEPRGEGGPNEPRNLIVLCPNCHRKADRGMISRSKLRRAIGR